jgi:hypothetical protein
MRIFGRAPRRRGLAGVSVFALAIGLMGGAAAQDAQDADPPTRVGRIAVLEGNVSFHASPDDPWRAALVNYPIAQAGQIFVEPESRAEIGLGEARVRLDGGAELDIVQFDDENVILSIPQGRVDIYVHGRHSEERYLVETPRGNVDISDDGHYRIFAGSPDSPTRVAAFHGLASIAEPTAELTINRGEEAVISPTDPPSFSVSPASEDGFDHWGEDRERHIVEGVSFRYVSQDMPGAGELDQYGSWRDDPQYGHVWVPTSVEAGWAPYRNGHWASVAPWGWTWVDDAPWGFAPFHYGRWVEAGGGWAWIPGEVTVHPVYAPALVAWVGDPGALIGGGGVGVSVGWIPLGPREVWVPPYHVSLNYIRAGNVAYVPPTVINNITVNNITVIHNNTTFVNQTHVTVVSQQNFTSAQPVQHAVVKIEPAVLSRPIVVASAPARILPPPPAHPPAAIVRTVAAPPAPTLVIAHPVAPTNNLAHLAPSPGRPSPQPAAAYHAPTPGAPGVAPHGPEPAAQYHPPGQPAAAPQAHEPEPQAHPGQPAAPTPQAHGPEPASQYHPPGQPGAPAPQAHEPEPQAHPSQPPAHEPEPQARPGQPAPQVHAPEPAPQVHPGQPPAPQEHEPEPQAHPGQPAPQVHGPEPAPQVHPGQPPAPQAHEPELQARPGQPAPQVHAPEPAPQARPAPAPQVHAPEPAPQAHAPAPPPAPAAHPPTPPAPAPQVHAPAPPPPAAHPAAPPPPAAAHPPAGQPPKKDDKDKDKDKDKNQPH